MSDKAAFAPAQHVARQQVAFCLQEMLRATSNMLHCCAQHVALV